MTYKEESVKHFIQVLPYFMTHVEMCSSDEETHSVAALPAGGEPEHRCQLPAGQNLNETIPMVLRGKTWRYSQCAKYVNYSISNETTSCDSGWHYDRTEFRTSIVSDVSFVFSLFSPNLSIFNCIERIRSLAQTSRQTHHPRYILAH